MTRSLLANVALVAGLVLMAQASAALQSSAEWPSLRFHFTLKRSAMKVYGQSDFSMYANPIVSNKDTMVLYDVFATFTEGTTLYNYTVINGIAHASSNPYSGSPEDDANATPSVSCLDSESTKLPAVNSIVAAINQVTAVSSVSGSDATISCSSSSLYKVTVNGIDFVLCAMGSSGFTMHGSDMDIAVEFLESPIDIQVPTSAATTKGGCSVVAKPSTISSIGQALLTGQPIPKASRNLKAAFDFSFRDKSSCSCKSTPRPCIFIHGLGVKQEMPENEDFFSYWGDSIIDHTPCCSSVKFAHLNTVNNTWTSKAQQGKVCNRALAVSNTSTESVITDTIVITHSLGNLMFAGALATKKCSLDSSSTWVGMAGPMIGSMASDFVQESCAGETNRFWEEVGDITGRCPPNTGLKSLAYQNGNFSSNELNKAYAAAQEAYRKNVYALMCGQSYSGLASKYQDKFWVLGHTIPHKSKENDGMVEFQSCAPGIPESKFGDNYRDRFYKTKLNHYDMQFLAGDALLDEDKMPVKWFECLL
ncbi:unnamed protein product [Phytophthora lilii]|uniref:Unnamed protein product n=1 Tax=Phytophthora lilii TaxID=2077276 RepID=A0A9W6TVQ5_9STRA|nr:unnamed protein product [Phytophthora lilii]